MTTQQVNQNIKRKVYVDMDGVIADFFAAIEKRYNVKHWKELDINQSIQDLKGTDFFGTIPKFKTSDKLIGFIDNLTNGEWVILSSPLRYDNDNSAFWKRHWLAKHNYTPSDAIFTGRKEKYARNRAYDLGNILIDDKPKNIEKWIAKGGIGILYQANQDSLQELYNKVTKYYGE
jgi:5'(3')-deoxyribonucleotidase